MNKKEMYSAFSEQLKPLYQPDIQTVEQQINNSITCWIGTRINKHSASMVCDYANVEMVKMLDKLMTL